MYNVTNSPPPKQIKQKKLCILDNSKHRIEKITTTKNCGEFTNLYIQVKFMYVSFFPSWLPPFIIVTLYIQFSTNNKTI